MGMSFIGVSSIHLLKDFVNAEHQQWSVIWMHAVIHGLFIISTLALAFTDKITHPTTEHHEDKIAPAVVGTSRTPHGV